MGHVNGNLEDNKTENVGVDRSKDSIKHRTGPIYIIFLQRIWLHYAHSLNLHEAELQSNGVIKSRVLGG